MSDRWDEKAQIMFRTLARREPQSTHDRAVVDYYAQALHEAAGQGEATAYLERQIEWSRRTFGEGRRTLGITKHIEKELAEIRQDPDDLKEWIDVVILALDGFWRHGGKPEDVMRMLQEKQDLNRTRVYPFPESEDEPCEHDRSLDSQQIAKEVLKQ